MCGHRRSLGAASSRLLAAIVFMQVGVLAAADGGGPSLKTPAREKEPQRGGCTFDVDCQDGNPCTVDTCDIQPEDPPGTGTCVHTGVPQGDPGECDDGDPCNGFEVCGAAQTCVGGSPSVCGNGILEPCEECDGPDDDACPGSCQVDCTCPCIRYELQPVAPYPGGGGYPAGTQLLPNQIIIPGGPARRIWLEARISNWACAGGMGAWQAQTGPESALPAGVTVPIQACGDSDDCTAAGFGPTEDGGGCAGECSSVFQQGPPQQPTALPFELEACDSAGLRCSGATIATPAMDDGAFHYLMTQVVEVDAGFVGTAVIEFVPAGTIFVDANSSLHPIGELIPATITVTPPPVCGNGAIEAGEECDSPSDAACPGQCTPPGQPGECTCECSAEPTAPDLQAEAGGVNRNRFIGVVVPPAAANRGPGTATAIRVTLTNLNRPRFCCTDHTGASCSATPCNSDVQCMVAPNTTCAHQAAPGFPHLSSIEGSVRYVNSFPGGSLVCNDDGPPFNTTYRCATLGCDPEFRDWATDLAVAVNPPALSGLLFVTGDAIVPSSTVHVQHIAESCGQVPAANTCTVASQPVIVETAHWGDITGPAFSPPDGKADVLDIPAVANKLKGVPTFFSEPRTWLKQRDPAANIDAITVVDLSDVVDSVLAKPYPASRTIDACPSDGLFNRDQEPATNDEPGVPHACGTCGADDGGVHLFSGEFHTSAVDLRIPGRGPDFVWARKYRSKIGPNTAVGNGWDFSYNIYLEEDGANLILHNGDGRSDLYVAQADGTWVRPEFFRIIEENLDTSFTVTFPDTSRWNFHPRDGSPETGKIKSSFDRNGNLMTFSYDGQGRLVTIHDSLDTAGHNRDITVSYNADGFIAAVCDFVGRCVTYDYYDGVEPGGSLGDLKSVTTAAVVNDPEFPIPPGHDYPSGKATVYTYSTGFSDARLNHNLLTITDPKGQTYLVNEYAAAVNPFDVDYDRVRRQTRGAPGDVIDLVYAPQVPAAGNDFAVMKAISNDRVGNVSEFSYDAANRLVVARAYTGRADPDQPTTESVNRPMGKLREDDPDYFETRYRYNGDSLLTRVLHPNANEEFFAYDSTNDSRRSQGNMLRSCALPGPLGGDQPEIRQRFEYDDEFGGCCGTNFVTRHVDGRGHETLHQYDASGNRLHTQHRIPSIVEDWEYNSFGQVTAHVLPDNGSAHRRRDEFTYHASGPQMGYLQHEIVDAAGFALTTTYEYDKAGNITRIIDPRGHDSFSVYNQLNQVVRTISQEVSDGSGVRYETDRFYDANDNVVRVDVQNKDESGALGTNSHFTTIHEYEVLNQPVRTCTESGAFPAPTGHFICAGLADSEFVITEYAYDANRNRTLVRGGEAVNGNQPANTWTTLYDERDFVFREIRAAADPDHSTTQYDYDGNGNLVRMVSGLEDAMEPRVTFGEYDGYDRLVRAVDAMGNETTLQYDANGNETRVRTEGELVDVLRSAGNVLLGDVQGTYDEMDRITQSTAQHFDAFSPIGDGQSTSVAEYTPTSQMKKAKDDNNRESRIDYDTANRPSVATDPKGNTLTYAYDANSNVVTITELEKSDLGNPDEAFVTTSIYDNLNRLKSTTDNIGNVVQYAYDSRGNLVRSIDALNREVRYAYDGLSRSTATIRDIDGDGADGDGPDITTGQSWDDDSRLAEQTDDNANATAPQYDALDREIATDMADCTQPTMVYDVHHNLIQEIDANGTDVVYTYDLANRVTSMSIVPGPGVSGETSFVTYQYDGLSRLVRAQDDDSLVSREYDSLSNVVREVQNQVPPFAGANDRVVASSHDGVGNRLAVTYPGGRIITTTYDELNRKKAVKDETGTSQMIASYDYVGPGRVERRTYGNGTRTDYQYDGIAPNPPGDFGVRNIVRTTHTKIAGGVIIDDRTFAWDKAGNKTERKDERAAGPRLTHEYSYDPAYRLTHTVVSDPSPAVVRDTQYVLDGVGNRLSVIGSPDAGSYNLDDAACEPADFQMNQYTSTPFDDREYDLNGNLVQAAESQACSNNAAQSCTIDANCPPIPNVCSNADQFCIADGECPAGGVCGGAGTCQGVAREFQYNYANIIVGHVDVQRASEYRYDALGRRIRKTVDVNGVAGGPFETRFYLDGWQEIEEQGAAGSTTATYVFGNYIDEALSMRRAQGVCIDNPAFSCLSHDDCAPPGPGGLCNVNHVTHYYHADDLYNVMALTDSTGAAVERYEYQDYGDPEFFDAGGALLLQSQVSNPVLFTGRRFNPETGLFDYRTRYLDPIAGRFTSRDTIGTWGDEGNAGNANSYVGNSPTLGLDPYGRNKMFLPWWVVELLWKWGEFMACAIDVELCHGGAEGPGGWKKIMACMDGIFSWDWAGRCGSQAPPPMLRHLFGGSGGLSPSFATTIVSSKSNSSFSWGGGGGGGPSYASNLNFSKSNVNRGIHPGTVTVIDASNLNFSKSNVNRGTSPGTVTVIDASNLNFSKSNVNRSRIRIGDVSMTDERSARDCLCGDGGIVKCGCTQTCQECCGGGFGLIDAIFCGPGKIFDPATHRCIDPAQGGSSSNGPIKMLTCAREATTKAHNVAQAIHKAQRCPTDSSN